MLVEEVAHLLTERLGLGGVTQIHGAIVERGGHYGVSRAAHYGRPMAHSQHFDPKDRVLGRLREICTTFPGADEKVSHGRPAFFTKKIFAIYGATTKGDHHSGRYDQSLVFLPDADEAVALTQHPRVFTPAYWGPHGWLGYDLSDTDTGADWNEVAELIEDSFRNTATKSRIAELEAR